MKKSMPPAEPRLRDRMKAFTRDGIIAAADRLFIERGYDDVSLEEVAAAAGVALRTLYRHFEIDTKESIALAYEADTFDRFELGLRSRSGGVVAYWKNFAAWGGKELEARGEKWLRGHLEMIHAVPSLEARHRLINARYERLLTAALAEETGKDDFHASLFASALIAGQSAVVQRWLGSGGAFDPRLFDAAIDYISEAFQPKAAQSHTAAGRALRRLVVASRPAARKKRSR